MSTTEDQVKAALNMNMGAINNRVKNEEAEKEEAKKNAKAPPTFHQKELARRAKMTDDKMANAQASGDGKVAGFFARLHNAAHPDHNQALSEFKNLYGSSEQKARNAIVAKEMEDYDCHPVETRDIAFESKTLDALRPKLNMSHTDKAHYNILKDSLNEEWMKRGYKGTQNVIGAWTAKYK